MSEKIKVLFVCLGNICRSPAAEALFAHHIKLAGIGDYFEIDSCGTGGWHAGELADERMRNTATNRGIEITHLARQLTSIDFEYFDYLLVMDHQNLADLKAISEQKQKNFYLITDFTQDFLSQIIPDPYFGDIKGFEKVFTLLDKVTNQVANTIFHQHKAKH